MVRDRDGGDARGPLRGGHFSGFVEPLVEDRLRALVVVDERTLPTLVAFVETAGLEGTAGLFQPQRQRRIDRPVRLVRFARKG